MLAAGSRGTRGANRHLAERNRGSCAEGHRIVHSGTDDACDGFGLVATCDAVMLCVTGTDHFCIQPVNGFVPDGAPAGDRATVPRARPLVDDGW